MYNFTPRRPVKSFQDLEVYQRLLAVSVAVAKRLGDQRDSSQKGGSNGIGSGAVSLALDLPVRVATAHSLRFSDQEKGIAILEEAMLGCNLLVVYLEQYRDIWNTGTVVKDSGNTGTGTIENEFFEEQIKTLLTVRFKVMHLQMSWKKFSKEKNA